MEMFYNEGVNDDDGLITKRGALENRLDVEAEGQQEEDTER